jgi:hypothetical protein
LFSAPQRFQIVEQWCWHLELWLDWATIQFRFFGPSSFNTALQLVLRPHFLVHFVLYDLLASYLVWSRTFLLGVGLTDLGHFGRCFSQNKEIVSVFNGSAVCFNVGIGLTFLGMSCTTRQESRTLLPAIFLKWIWPSNVVEILCPEVNLRPPHNIQNILISICSIAREGASWLHWEFLAREVL